MNEAMQQDKPRRLHLFFGLAFGLFSTLQWASFYPVGRFMFGDSPDNCDPFLLTMLRYVIALFAFAPIVFLSSRRRGETKTLLKNNWQDVLFLAFSGMVMDGVLVFSSLQFTTAARSSLLANTSPIFTVIIACLWMKHKITGRMLTGMIIGFGGILLAFFTKNQDAFTNTGATQLFGDILALGSAICWAAYTVGGEKVAGKFSIWTVTEFVYLAAICFLLLIMTGRIAIFGINGFSAIADMTPRLWIGTAYLAIFPCGIAMWSWFTALKFVSSDQLGAFGYLSAILSALASMIALHENLPPRFVIAVILVVCGVAMMLRKKSA